ncbi:MAG: hypothetical protein IKW06_02185 [Clostridia bacterium]|nr:hypothetical protein [Clostridia bacterium]
MNKIVKRSDKLAFFGVKGPTGTVTYHRMKGFNEITTQKGPIEYSRQYVDQEFEQSDVVGYSPSISYSFDQFEDNEVHLDLVKIADRELVGEDAVRSIIMVDLTDGNPEGDYSAVKRDFVVLCESEGDSMDAYTYAGVLKVKGEKVFGVATSVDSWETCSFIKL